MGGGKLWTTNQPRGANLGLTTLDQLQGAIQFMVGLVILAVSVLLSNMGWQINWLRPGNIDQH